MKKILLYVSVLLFTSLNYAQKIPQKPLTKVDSMLVHIDKKTLTSGILYERVTPWAALDEFNGSNENMSSPRHFEQALHELYIASNKQKFVYYRDLRNKYTNEKFQNVVDVGIINATFQTLNYNAESKDLGGLRLVNNVYQPVKGEDPFLTKHVLVVSPLKKYVVGQTIVFNFDKSFFFEETEDKRIINLVANFGTNQKHTLINKDILNKQSISVNYKSTGEKTISFTAQFSDGTSVTTKAKIHVKVVSNSTLKSGGNLIESHSIVSTIPFQGYDESTPINGQLEYRIFYDLVNNNTVLNKPIVIIDGFDPLDKRKIQDSDPHPGESDVDHVSIEEMMIYFDSDNDPVEIIEELRGLGYDVIIVNHPVYTRTINGVVTQIDGGADYIERNAMNHVTLYQHLNSVLAQNNSNEELVIVGPSMGGQISRYALAYMEKTTYHITPGFG
ncbi:hypothetical protein UMM65_00370 [Aureibaculum sp. 2210JD6-5]|uniref:esterase/lipase family protein n=1 Tax=Aureibaculum sp. 2210JD6-5 TaxID=3103957 RepID=UPI002AAC5DD9|nr:hypothetical protein [Aureibaculum sp. 2210JD6-5]MDY7393683.1 hypothetical protein [Aureibaculum sp. 2210JD6-5]